MSSASDGLKVGSGVFLAAGKFGVAIGGISGSLFGASVFSATGGATYNNTADNSQPLYNRNIRISIHSNKQATIDLEIKIANSQTNLVNNKDLIKLHSY